MDASLARLGWSPQEREAAEQREMIIELLRHIKELLQPKPKGRPKKVP